MRRLLWPYPGLKLLELVAWTGTLASVYFLFELLVRSSFSHPEHVPAADLAFFLIVTTMVIWCSLWAYGRVRIETLEGVRDLLTQAGIAMSMTDRRGRILWYNPALARLFELGQRSWVGRHLRELIARIHSTEAQTKLERLLACIAGGQRCHDEVDLPLPDGRRLTIFYAVSPVRGHRGQLLGALGIVMDITERKRLAEELRASRDNLARLLEAISAAVVVVQASTGQPILWNCATERLIGIPCQLEVNCPGTRRFMSPAVGRVFDAQGNELAPEDMALFRTLRTHEPLSEQHYVLEFTDGRRLDIAESTAFLDTPDGGQGVLIFQDISGIQQLQRELGAERVAAEQLKAVLATVATLNHEINNPLTAILGAADIILAQAELNPTTRRYAEMILDLARRINDDLHQLSALTRVERRKEKGFEPFLEVEPKAR